MDSQPAHRKLAAILAADVAGYSRLMEQNEEATLNTLNVFLGVMRGMVEEHEGRIVGTAGDSVLAEFASPVQAVRSAVAVQRALRRRNMDLPEDRRMRFRVGINLGDVIAQGNDLLGDGVNIAARLEQAAEPGAIFISGSVWEQIQGKLSFPCEYFGEQSVKNISRPVRTYRVGWELEEPINVEALAGGALRLPDKQSIAVLPFTNMSGDADQEYFADGISEDIITAISKWRWLFVIARNSSFAYKGKNVDVKQVGRELGVRYVLEGSVRKAGARVRISAQLIEAATGRHLWAERYDRDLADIFALQDEITQSVVAAIEPELLLAEGQRAASKMHGDLGAFDHFLRGVWHHDRYTMEDNRIAESLLKKAVDIDPRFPQGFMGLARVRNRRIWYSWSDDIDGDIRGTLEAARRAVELDDKDPYAHYMLAWATLNLRDHERALAAAQKALDLNANFALAYFILGIVRVFLGRFEAAIEPLQRAMRLSPHDPQTDLFVNFIALAQYHMERYEEAAKSALSGIDTRPTYLLYRTLAAAYGQLGRTDKAAAALAEMRRLMPKDTERFWIVTNPYAKPEHLERVVEGLRKAGWTG